MCIDGYEKIHTYTATTTKGDKMPDVSPIWINTIRNKRYNLFNGTTTMNAVEIYKYLIEKFDKVDVSTDADFQEAYRKFFKTTLGPDRQITRKAGQMWHKLYFELLQSLKGKSELSIEKEIENFYTRQQEEKLNAKFEMSFISKALHMVDHNLPIWDRNIRATLLGLTHDPLTRIQDEDQRIQEARRYYDLIKDRIQAAIKTDKTKDKNSQIITQFRVAFPTEEKGITDVKVMDFYYWITYKLLPKKPKKIR